MQRRELLGLMAALPFGPIAASDSADTRRHTPPTRIDAVVIGAGLAGLSAALSLQESGLRVQVLEALKRVGGRLKTIERDGARFEVGALEVASGYRRVQALIDQYQVPLLPTDEMPIPGQTLFHADRLFDVGEWPGHPYNPSGTGLRNQPPTTWLQHWLDTSVWRPAPEHWNEARVLARDQSLGALLRSQVATAEELRLASVGANYNDLFSTSALDALRRDGLRKALSGGTSNRVAAGNQALVETLAAALQQEVLTGSMVLSIQRDGREWRIEDQVGRRWRTPRVVVAIPAAAAAQIDLAPALPTVLVPLLFRRHYTSVLTLHFRPKSPYWEADGLSPNLWMDGPLERMFAIGTDAGHVQRLVVWINGTAAQRAGMLSLGDLRRWVLSELQRIRPSTHEQLEFLAVQRWGSGPISAGAYPEAQAGELAAIADGMAALPEALPAGLAFAGDHLRFDVAGMEAAVAAGADAAAQVRRR